METNTIELRGEAAMRAIFSIDLAHFGKLKVTEGVYGVKFKERALLVEPVNGSPFVLIDETADSTPGTIPLPIASRVEFVPEEGSGTDAMRARIHADLFFENLKTRLYATQASTSEILVKDLRAATKPKLDPCQLHDQASTEAIEAEEAVSSPGR